MKRFEFWNETGQKADEKDRNIDTQIHNRLFLSHNCNDSDDCKKTAWNRILKKSTVQIKQQGKKYNITSNTFESA